MNKISFLLVSLLLVTTNAFAVAVQPVPAEESSPGLQLARRVASMENQKDLPSRAVWLGQRVAKNSRLAYQAPAPKRHAKKKPVSVQN